MGSEPCVDHRRELRFVLGLEPPSIGLTPSDIVVASVDTDPTDGCRGRCTGLWKEKPAGSVPDVLCSDALRSCAG